jgi:hypothetical protein
MSAAASITVTGVAGLPEVEAGADLATLIADAEPDLADGDIVVVTSKIVSKAEGRVVRSGREEAIDAACATGSAPESGSSSPTPWGGPGAPARRTPRSAPRASCRWSTTGASRTRSAPRWR